MSKTFNTQVKTFELDLKCTDNANLEEVVICSKCMGYGSYDLVNSFMIYGSKIKSMNLADTCSYCNGTDKLMKQTKVKFIPFDYKLSLKTQILRNPENLI